MSPSGALHSSPYVLTPAHIHTTPAQIHTDTKYTWNSTGMLVNLGRTSDATLLTPLNVSDPLVAMHHLTQAIHT